MAKTIGAFIFLVMGVLVAVLLAALNLPQTSPAIWMIAGMAIMCFALMFAAYLVFLFARGG